MRPRFSLRLLLILFTLIAILFGVAAHFVYREKEKVRRHKLAVEKLNSKGIEFETHFQSDSKVEGESAFRQFVRTRIDHEAYPYVGQVMLDFTPGRLMHIKPTEALDYLREVQCVKELVFTDERITNEIAERLARLPDLTSLHLYFEFMDVEVAKVIGQMSELEELHLHGRIRLPDLQVQGGVNDESMKAIADHSRLKVLSVQSRVLSESGLSSIRGIKTLTSLQLFSQGKLPDEFCRELAQFPHLEELTIWGGPALDGEQLRHLLACQKLSTLNLPQTTFSESDLRAFDDHPTLTDLTFVGDLPQESIKQFLRKKKRRVIRQHVSPDSGAGLLYTMQDDDLYTHDLSSAF